VAGLPRQIPFIIGNEAAERFSFYGMRNILTSFLAGTLLLNLPEAQRDPAAKDIFHTFVIGVYFFPLIGGWVADRFFGKYRTIFWLSLLYCVGHACLAIFEDDKRGFYTGLFLIALGAGGVKPLISAFVGDQFDKKTQGMAKTVYDYFYMSINVGSFFASLTMPLLLRHHGPAWAFGVPGILMAIATFTLWLGRHRYVHVPPAPPDPNSFTRVAVTALKATSFGQVLGAFACFAAVGALFLTPKLGFVASFCLGLVLFLGIAGIATWTQLERARGAHPDESVDAVRGVLRVLIVFALVTPFWSLFDQKASTWVLQANAMAKPDWFHPAQMQALNPALVLLLIPFNNTVLFPAIRRLGIEITPLRRITVGMASSGVSWIIAGALQLALDGGSTVPITWQILPYVFLTFGECLVSATGLEFAYSQAPPSMKGVIMSFWLLTTTIGNLWVLLSNVAVRNESVIGQITEMGVGVTAFQMFAFAGFALLAALAFAFYSRRYQMVDYYRPS
jgi:proton-dependent oligopeptide transporter, POT family